VPIAIEMALLNHNISGPELANGVVTRDTIDLLELAGIRLIIFDLITSKLELFNEKFKGAITDLGVQL